jgi:glycosyltransferase involved in cell wall biosynthesis
MPVFNAERYLAAALDSILAQTHRDWELVCVDDGSTDASLLIAEAYARKDPRIRPLRNERNLGIVKTRNRAFAEANPASKYFAIMDGDDVCAPDRLERQVAFLEAHPDHAVVGGNTRIIDERSAPIGERVYPSSHEQIIRVITRYNPIANPTAMIRRSALAEVGEYDERYSRCQDYDLWLRMASRFKIANLDAFTLDYRITTTQGKVKHLRDSLRFTLEIQRRWLFHPPFRRAFNVVYFAAEHGLLLLPEPVVLALFKRLTYRQGKSAA